MIDVSLIEAYVYKPKPSESSQNYLFLSSNPVMSSHEEITTVDEMIEMFGNIDKGWNRMYFRVWRNHLKRIIKTIGSGNEEAGFDLLTSEQKKFCAGHNIGTAIQRLNAIPVHFERDTACFNFICLNEGINADDVQVGSKFYGATFMKAMAFSRCDHIVVTSTPFGNVYLSGYLFGLLDIASPTAMEFVGNLLELYKHQGLDGIALGTPPVGVADFIASTIGTRYETTGLITNAVIAAVVAADAIGIAGYGKTATDIENFAKDLMFVVKFGIPKDQLGD